MTVQSSTQASGKMPVSCQQQFIPGSNVPIFSDQFLQHNRGMSVCIVRRYSMYGGHQGLLAIVDQLLFMYVCDACRSIPFP